MNAIVGTNNQNTSTGVYRHAKREAWGVAVFLWEREGKRAFQFEDGKLRVFREGYFHMLEPVATAADSSTRTVKRLARRAAADSSLRRSVLTRVRDQIALFASEFPDGFSGEAWQAAHRGSGAKRALKRHRDPVVGLARVNLDKDALARVIEAADWTAVHARALEVLSATDLVTNKDRKAFADLEPNEELARSIVALVHGDDGGKAGFGRFANELRRQRSGRSWQLMTALRALVHPTEDLCVRPSVMRAQARIMLPSFSPGKRANFASYRRFLETARLVQAELTAAGHVPADLLDVHDFVWMTLRPSARGLLAAGVDTDQAA